MRTLRMCTVLLAAVTVTLAAPSPGRSTGQSSASITFSNERWQQPRPWDRRRQPPASAGGVPPASAGGIPPASAGGIPPASAGSIQFGETSATSVQMSSGDGKQTNVGQASGVSVQQQSGLGGATQTTNNQALIQAAQEATGGPGGGGAQQSSNNQVNIQSSQVQQNVNGTLVNVDAGNKGVVIINTNDPTGAVVNQEVINNKPKGKETAESAKCRYVCYRQPAGQPYCCDNGSNRRGDPNEIHGGMCPDVRVTCNRNEFFRKCAHDGQCAPSDKCCYDTCAQHHICKTAD